MPDISFIPLDAILSFSFKMLAFLGGLAALIFVHELGHFLIARRFGVIVEKFSLGFGPKLFGFKSGETEFLVAAIPLGGYVKMKGEDPGEELADSTGSFSSAPVLHRIAIAFGGPLFNIIFAIVIYLGVYMVGVPTMGTTIGNIRVDSPAQNAGLQTGDRILKIDGQETLYWDQLLEIVHNAPGHKMDFLIERHQKTLINIAITPRSEEITNLFGEKEKVGLIGVTPLATNIYFVEEGSAADRAGLKENDRLISVDGVPIKGWPDLKTTAMDHPGKSLKFRIQRDGVEQELELIPDLKVVTDEAGREQEIGVLGIGLSGEMELEKYGPWDALKRSIHETGRWIYLITVSIKKMIFGSVSADSLGGPILIFQIYGQQAQQGFSELVRLTALLSINLGLINLLPIPILDGGHIFFFLIELIKGRPVSEKNRERASQVGLFMILSLMIFVFYNDIMRIVN